MRLFKYAAPGAFVLAGLLAHLSPATASPLSSGLTATSSAQLPVINTDYYGRRGGWSFNFGYGGPGWYGYGYAPAPRYGYRGYVAPRYGYGGYGYGYRGYAPYRGYYGYGYDYRPYRRYRDPAYPFGYGDS